MRPLRKLILLAALASAGGAAHAQLHLMLQHAYLWDRPDFHGHAITIVGGTDDLADEHFAGRALSGSFEGAWTICDDRALRGHCAVVHGDAPDVTRAGLAGPIMSLRPRPRG